MGYHKGQSPSEAPPTPLRPRQNVTKSVAKARKNTQVTTSQLKPHQQHTRNFTQKHPLPPLFGQKAATQPFSLPIPTASLSRTDRSQSSLISSANSANPADSANPAPIPSILCPTSKPRSPTFAASVRAWPQSSLPRAFRSPKTSSITSLSATKIARIPAPLTNSNPAKWPPSSPKFAAPLGERSSRSDDR